MSASLVLVPTTRWQKWIMLMDTQLHCCFLGKVFFFILYLFIYFLKSLSNFNSTPLHVFNSMMPIIPVYGSLQCY